MRYAVATGRAERDPTADLRGTLAPVVSTNHAAITEPKRIGELLRAIDGYQGQPSTAYALKLAPLVFVRPGELRAAQWSEFELDGDEPRWRIPGSRMKMGEQHIVPQSPQALAILLELRDLTGDGKYLFPSLEQRARLLRSASLLFDSFANRMRRIETILGARRVFRKGFPLHRLLSCPCFRSHPPCRGYLIDMLLEPRTLE